MGRGSGGVTSSRKGISSGTKTAQAKLNDSMSALYVAYSGTKTPAGAVAAAKLKVKAAVSKLPNAKLIENYKSTSDSAYLFTDPKAKGYNEPHNRANRELLKAYSAEVKKRKLTVE